MYRSTSQANPPQEERPAPVVQNVRVEPGRRAVFSTWSRQALAEQISVERIVQSVYFAFGALEAGLLLRFVLKAIGANPNNPFAILVYGLTRPFVVLFETLVTNPAANGYAVEVTTLIAMMLYAVLAWGIARFIWLMFAPRPT